jgi:hypothetical protein
MIAGHRLGQGRTGGACQQESQKNYAFHEFPSMLHIRSYRSLCRFSNLDPDTSRMMRREKGRAGRRGPLA